MKMEATYCSETSVDFQRTTRRYIPEDRTLQRTNLLALSLHRVYFYVNMSRPECMQPVCLTFQRYELVSVMSRHLVSVDGVWIGNQIH
jgi:hypothetical protein